MCFYFVGLEDLGQVFNVNERVVLCHLSPSWLRICFFPVPCCLFPVLFQPDAVHIIPTRHIGKNHRVAFLQAFDHLDAVH